MKVVLDTNIWISFLIGGMLPELVEKIIDGRIKLVITKALLQELTEVVNRPKFKKIFTREKVKELLALLSGYTITACPSERISDCRDEKDNIILEAAVTGGVKYIVTGDDDLLVLNPYRNILIIKPAEFARVLKAY